MNRYRKAFAAGVLILAVAASAATSWAQAFQFPEFSADVQMKDAKPGDTVTGKMYFSGQRWRMDTEDQGHKSIMIVDLPKKISYMIMPAEKMYMELRTDYQMPGAPRTPDLNPAPTIPTSPVGRWAWRW